MPRTNLWAGLVRRGWCVPLGVLCLLAFLDVRRAQRVLHVTSLEAGSSLSDASSPTGYAGGRRQLIVPEQNVESYQWITQAQQSLAEGTLRIRRTTMDNWPEGREVHAASPYRWYLALLAWVHHSATDTPLGRSVEWAALVAGPLLRALALIAVATFTARRFGGLAASLVALGWVGCFPFSVTFLPAQPDSTDLARLLALGSVLLLVAAATQREPSRDARTVRRLAFLSGVAGGCGLWLSVQLLVPVIAGIGIGAWALRRLRRSRLACEESGAAPPLPWMTWACSGAGTTLLAFLFEYAPAGPALWNLEAVHPLYAIAWFGLGGVLQAGAESPNATSPNRRRWVGGVVGLVALVALPVTLWLAKTPGFLSASPLDHRLHGLPGSPEAGSLGESLALVATSPSILVGLLPVLFVVACVLALRAAAGSARKWDALLIACGPLLLAAAWACFRPRWWATAGLLGVPLLAIAGVTLAGSALPRARRSLCFAVLAGLLLPGAVLTALSTRKDTAEAVTEKEAEALMERRLAAWLQNRTGEQGARVLASPKLSASLAYFGSVKVLTSPYLENQDGFQAAVRIASATLPDEAQALAAGRQLTHIALASWSPELTAMARLRPTEDAGAPLVQQLESWMPPRWLRPLAYHLPRIEGLPEHTLALFEVVELQDQATALARLAEYFAEMGQMNHALSVVGTLIHHFPDDPGGAAARAHVALARRDKAEFSEATRILLADYSQPQIDELAWERRVSLAMVLAQAGRVDQARATAQACLAEADEERLRSASPASLFRFLGLAKALGLAFGEAGVRERALQMLTPEMQDALTAQN